MAPHHDIWQRSRRAYHGGAIRAYAKPPSPQYGRTSPVHCERCARTREGGEGEERKREGETKGEGWGAWEEDSEAEDPLPKFDLLDEIDFSTGMAKGGRLHTLPAPIHTPPSTLHSMIANHFCCVVVLLATLSCLLAAYVQVCGKIVSTCLQIV